MEMPHTILPEILLKILVCPVCHRAVAAGPDNASHAWLHCIGCGRYYPVEDGIPVMLEQRATPEPPQVG
jgi:uncharacterized protein YbaR (Trm112 family)